MPWFCRLMIRLKDRHWSRFRPSLSKCMHALFGSRLGETLSICMLSWVKARRNSLLMHAPSHGGLVNLSQGIWLANISSRTCEAMHVLSPALQDETNSSCTCSLWVGSSLHARALFGWRLGPISSPGGHWPIVCFFAPSHGSHCQWCIAYLLIWFRLVVDPMS